MNALPQSFIDMLAATGCPALQALPEVMQLSRPEVSIRRNEAKGCVPATNADRVPWCPAGEYLADRPAFTLDPALHQGLYYVQDASSMAIDAVAAAIAPDAAPTDRPLRYLDACAAPGGKTGAAAAALRRAAVDFVMVANEYDPRRADILAENVAKWGDPYIIVTRGDTAHFSSMTDAFDIIAADVPCSGEGMMRKDAQAVAQWSPALVRQCAATAAEIIDRLWPALRQGGYLIFSTCTFNRDENELAVERICDRYGAEPVAVPLLDNAPGVIGGIDTPHRCYRFIPGSVRGEGLFIAVLRKPGDTVGQAPATSRRRARGKAPAMPPDAAAYASRVLAGTDCRLTLHPDGERLFALDSRHAAFLDMLAAAHPAIIAPGTHIASLRGRDMLPAQPLALTTMLRREAFACCAVDLPAALDYLRHNAIALPGDTPRGIVLLTFGDRPLGFVKNLGNRANNLYPAPWRIRL